MHSASQSALLTQLVPAAQPNVAGIILAGSADFKTELSQSDLFDIRQGLTSVLAISLGIAYMPLNADCKP